MQFHQRIFIVATIAFFSLIIGCGPASSGAGDKSNQSSMGEGLHVEVQLARVVREDLASSIELVGNFLPYKRTILVAEVDAIIADIPDRRVEFQGEIFELPLDIGAEVEKGELLVQLDDSEFQIRKEVALADLAKAQRDLEMLIEWTRPEDVRRLKATVAEAEARRQNILADLRRGEGLVRSNAISESEVDRLKSEATASNAVLDRAQAALDTALAGPTKAELAVAEAVVSQEEAKVKQAQWKIDRTSLRAPYDAMITDRYVDEGDRVTALPRVEIMELMNVSILSAEIGVPQRYMQAIHVGDLAIIMTSDDSKSVQGVVARINHKIDPATRTFRVRVGVRNPDHRFHVGQFVRVKLDVKTAAKTLVIPRQALVFSGGQPQVFVLRDGKANRRDVQLGIEAADSVEVISGLTENEQVVVDDPSVLTDAMPVRVRRSADKESPNVGGGR